MRIEIYIDDATEPFQVIRPPEKFKLDTAAIADGQHVLRFRAIDKGNDVSERVVPFFVQNGPEIAVHGLKAGDTISGEITILANAYSSRIGDEFEPVRIETPAPIPTWAWVLVLVILAWGAGYLSQELHNQVDMPFASSARSTDAKAADSRSSGSADWAVLGEQVYGNNCASCHQVSGSGLPGVFPPLKGNPAITADDPGDHISAILHGLSGKTIDGVSYPAPMAAFGTLLSDADVAAVVNHERAQWGNNAPLVTAADVAERRYQTE